MKNRSLVFFLAAMAPFVMAPQVHAEDALLSEVKSRGALRVCHADYPPYNFKNPKTNTWEGINVDLAENLAEKLGVDLKHVDANWGTLPQSIMTNKCDLSVAATYVTPERAELVLFTQKVSQDAITAIVPKDSPYHTWEELDQPGNVVAVWAGAFEEPIARDFFDEATVKPLVIDKVSSGVLEVANGRADAYFSSVVSPARFIKKNPQLELRTLGDRLLRPTSIAFMLPRREYHFQQYLNVWIDQLQQSGQMEEIQRKWLGELGS